MVIVDLELTQPAGQIIQIGAVSVNTNTRTIERFFDATANPGDVPTAFITELTGITQSDVRQSKPLATVLSDFWYAARQHGKNLAAWGSDWDDLRKASHQYKISFDWPRRYDLKQMVNFYTHFDSNGNVPLKQGLKAAMEEYGLEFEGRQHNAADDAYNTARLFLAMLDKIQGK